MTRLSEVTSDIRSKNAGPFWITVDVFLPDDETYRRVAASPLTDSSTVGHHFGVSADRVRVFSIPELRVIKVSLPRPRPQGSLGERDMHGGQQFVPLLDIEIGQHVDCKRESPCRPGHPGE